MTVLVGKFHALLIAQTIGHWDIAVPKANNVPPASFYGYVKI